MNNLRAVEVEMDMNRRYGDAYEKALAQLMKDASPEQVGDVLSNWYDKDLVTAMETFLLSPKFDMDAAESFHKMFRLRLADSLSNDASASANGVVG